jgi:hypothetical protein
MLREASVCMCKLLDTISFQNARSLKHKICWMRYSYTSEQSKHKIYRNYYALIKQIHII